MITFIRQNKTCNGKDRERTYTVHVYAETVQPTGEQISCSALSEFDSNIIWSNSV